jgi:NAD(P)-dependent dehydrogenase (short-subunit alcohol dehydrogenase family)
MQASKSTPPSKAYRKVHKPFDHSKLSLRGKLILVTGGSGTIGYAIAQALLQRGARVIITGRRRERLEQAVRTLEPYAQFPEDVKFIPCDVADERSVENLFSEMDILVGTIDILVNNAGTNVAGKTVDMTAYEFNKVMQVNVMGCFLCAREAMKRFQARGTGGRIINIGSLSATCPRPDSAAYTTSKFALKGLTQSLALDGRAHNISVGIIHPGNVASDLLTEEMIEHRKEEGFLQPSNVADCVVHMASSPHTATVLEMTVYPTQQPFVGRG